MNSLAAEYGFRAFFFWQPSLAVGEKPLTDVERRIRERDTLVPFTQRVYARFRARAATVPGVHDLADVFAGDASLAYFDSHHTTPEANGTIGEAIGRVVAR